MAIAVMTEEAMHYTGRWSRCLLAVSFVALTAAAADAPSDVSLPGDSAFPESVTSTADGTLYAGSFAEGGVFRAQPGQAKAEQWIKPGAYGSRSTMGVLADERSNTLWVCSNDVSAMGVPGPGSAKGSALKGFDLKTGKGKVSAAFPGSQTFCNDMAIGPDGSVYVTNTRAPQILRLRPGAKELEVWATDPQFAPPAHGAGLDGIAFGGDGNLYVDTFTGGELFRIDVKDGVARKVTKLHTRRKLVLTDALRRTEGNTFLLIEGDGKLDRITVNGDDVSVDTLKQGFAGPTGVTQTGSTAWVSEGQLSDLIGPEKGKKKPRLPFKLYAVRL
jgi:sugar lactone lactonase YvrE